MKTLLVCLLLFCSACSEKDMAPNLSDTKQAGFKQGDIVTHKVSKVRGIVVGPQKYCSGVQDVCYWVKVHNPSDNDYKDVLMYQFELEESAK